MRHFLICLLTVLLLLAGCSGVTSIEIDHIQLMPEPVAYAIMDNYGLDEWAKNPFLLHKKIIGCNEGKRYVDFAEIEGAYYSREEQEFSFALYDIHDVARNFTFCYAWGYTLENISENEAEELVAAAITLGADIKHIDNAVLGDAY